MASRAKPAAQKTTWHISRRFEGGRGPEALVLALIRAHGK